MRLEDFIREMRPAVEDELRRVIDRYLPPGQPEMSAMMAYHLGWEGEGAGIEAQGKRIRPLLVLLSAASTGGDWRIALPAAAAVELIHNFSLIHDDIQDHSRLRRGRPTVWVKWGIPQAINAGDIMFTLAHQAIFDLVGKISPERVLDAAKLLDETCIKLTEGQYLDLSYETRREIGVSDYWPMIKGKTAALLGCCTELGALTGTADSQTREAYKRFGISLGLAFQVLDDWLGIWGDAALTGKSTESDLISGKKTLPVLYGLEKNGAFAQRWRNGKMVTSSEVSGLAAMLADDGVQEKMQQQADALTGEALQALADTGRSNEAAAVLRELAETLLNRKK